MITKTLKFTLLVLVVEAVKLVRKITQFTQLREPILKLTVLIQVIEIAPNLALAFPVMKMEVQHIVVKQ